MALLVPVPLSLGDLKGQNVAHRCAGTFAKFPLYFEPVALLAVWLERRLKRKAIDGAFDRRHAAGGQLHTGVLWQDEKCPACLRVFRRRESFALKRIVVLVILLDKLPNSRRHRCRSWARHIYQPIIGMQSSERDIAWAMQDSWLCADLRSIFSQRSAILHL